MIDNVVMDELATEMHEYYTTLLARGLPSALVIRMVGDLHEQIVSIMLVEDALGSDSAGVPTPVPTPVQMTA